MKHQSIIYSVLGLSCLWLTQQTYAGVTLAETPLYLTNDVAPNVLLEVSVETPMGGAAFNDQTNTSVATTHEDYCAGRQWVRLNDNWRHAGTCFNPAKTYLGYFDSEKCYSYNSTNEYFYPVGYLSSPGSCNQKFNGNYMNWATMTAMDMFTYTMTGGNRVIDTNSNAATYNTVIQRARKTNNDGWFPFKMIGRVQSTQTGVSVTPSSYTPYTGKDAVVVYNWSNRFDFTPYNWSSSNNRYEKGSTTTYKARVAVCVDGMLEANCIKYGDVYKPEGLIQENADNMRFAVSGYLNDNTNSRDGGVMRTLMKYIGRTLPDGTANSAAEINTNGTFVTDPDNDAVDTYSGVINYVNRFNQEADYKSLDPIAELYYESLRYLMGMAVPTAEYINNHASYNGKMPVQTTWDDPWQYSCQQSFIIGLNDANPWYDKSVPGTSFTSNKVDTHSLSASDYGEPSTASTFTAISPTDFASQTVSAIDVSTLTDTVGQLEGLNGTDQCIGCVIGGECFSGADDIRTISTLGDVMGTCPYTGKENSYYIAGLAYMANTYDVRPDMAGVQNIQTFMIDTQEYATNPLTGQMNMLWLAAKYGGFEEEEGSENYQPDLASEWDEDGDGNPDNYVYATNPAEMVRALQETFSEIDRRTSSSSTVAANSSRLNTGTTVFQATFDSGSWSGELSAYAVNQSDGSIATNPTWQATNKMPAAASRSIYTREDDGTPVGIAFQWANLTSTQQTALNKDMYGDTDGLGSTRVDYIRGDTTVWDDVTPNFREREEVLGDIVNSNPLYVYQPDFGYAQYYSGLTATEKSAYLSFRNTSAYKNRPAMVYVGANDGMLHGFNATTGVEEFAYIPSELISRLPELTDQRYTHKYFVDGSPRYGDAYIGSAWKTVLIGSTGAGGKSVYALDVTTPGSFATGDVLWEFSSSDDNNLGNVLGQPTIARLTSGDWVALVGNGPNGDGDVAKLFVLDLSDGSVIAEISTGAGDATNPNGLFAPVPVDADGDRDADFVYAGDMLGNLWKFEFNVNNGNWSSSPTLIFTACETDTTTCPATDRQPITVRPTVVEHAGGTGFMIYFGTGRYFTTGDDQVPASPRVDAFYGIWDDMSNSPTISRLSELVEQSIIVEDSATNGNGEVYNYRIVSNNTVDYTTKHGWYMKLQQIDNTTIPSSYSAIGERVVNDAVIRGDRLVFTSMIPDSNACSYGGTGWLMEVDALTGGRLTYSAIDVNNDGAIDSADQVLLNGNLVPPSGSGSSEIINGPTVIEAEDGQYEYKYTSGSSGSMDTTLEIGSGTVYGRQSWRQLK